MAGYRDFARLWNKEWATDQEVQRFIDENAPIGIDEFGKDLSFELTTGMIKDTTLIGLMDDAAIAELTQPIEDNVENVRRVSWFMYTTMHEHKLLMEFHRAVENKQGISKAVRKLIEQLLGNHVTETVKAELQMVNDRDFVELANGLNLDEILIGNLQPVYDRALANIRYRVARTDKTHFNYDVIWHTSALERFWQELVIDVVVNHRPPGICRHCGRPVPVQNRDGKRKRADAEFCSSDCQQAADSKRYRERIAAAKGQTLRPGPGRPPKGEETRAQKLEQARVLHGEIARKVQAAGITDQQLKDDVRKARAHVRKPAKGEHLF